ncbi:MAG: hypothetical protein AAFN77_12290 [Planctomycetota bacterium]
MRRSVVFRYKVKRTSFSDKETAEFFAFEIQLNRAQNTVGSAESKMPVSGEQGLQMGRRQVDMRPNRTSHLR